MRVSAVLLSILFLAAAAVFGPGAASAKDKSGKNLILLKKATIDTSAGEGAISLNGLSLEPEGAGFYIVQFDDRVLASWKDDLEAMGVKLFSYIPNNAFIAKMDASKVDVVLSHDHVQYVGPYKKSYKTPAGLDSMVPLTAVFARPTMMMSGTYPTLELKIKIFDTESVKPVKKMILELGGKVEVVSNGDGLNQKYLWAELPADRVGDIAAMAEVEWMEKYTTPAFQNKVAQGFINVSAIHALPYMTFDGLGQVVGVMDTGLDTGDLSTLHIDFAGTAANGKPKVKAAIGYRSDGDWSDINGHGTHVAGSIVGLTGVAPGAELVFQSDQTFRQTGLHPDLNTVVFWDALRAGAYIHNDSWASLDPGTHDVVVGEYFSTSVDVDTFTWEHQNFLPVFAAGNEAKDRKFNSFGAATTTLPEYADGVVDLGSVTAPGTAKNALTVGASESVGGFGSSYFEVLDNITTFPLDPIISDYSADDPDGLAAFSGRGPTADGRIKPDVVAPGTSILSTWSQASLPYYYDSYGYMSGTSMATPQVTGSAALVRQYLTSMRGAKRPSAALIKAMLINGAYYLPGQYGNDSFTRPDMHQGFGRVDVLNTIYPGQADPTRYVVFEDVAKRGLLTDTGASHRYYVENPGEVRVTLVWTDYPGAAGAGKALVNDLDLTVYSPDGDVYTGNRNNTNTFDAPWDDEDSCYDHTNNVEEVVFTPGLPGPVIINIQGYNVPQGKRGQPYALVVSGGLGNDPLGNIAPLLYSMSGTVIGSSNAPLPGSTVSLNGPVVASAATDGSGNFSITGLIPGVYYINALGPGGETPAKPNMKKKIKNRDVFGLTIKVQ